MKGRIITITKAAGKKINEIASDYNSSNILFYAKGGGCNGFNYILEPISKDDINKKDEVIKCDSVNIIVCYKSLLHLLGTTIDYKKDIMGETFHFINPNAKAKCGCGTSFSI